jgi:hypothetical protein
MEKTGMKTVASASPADAEQSRTNARSGAGVYFWLVFLVLGRIDLTSSGNGSTSKSAKGDCDWLHVIA